MNPIVWIVGRVRNAERPLEWEVMGVFDSEDKAVAACTEYYDFVGPETMNVRLSDNLVPWEGSYYPLAEKAV